MANQKKRAQQFADLFRSVGLGAFVNSAANAVDVAKSGDKAKILNTVAKSIQQNPANAAMGAFTALNDPSLRKTLKPNDTYNNPIRTKEQAQSQSTSPAKSALKDTAGLASFLPIFKGASTGAKIAAGATSGSIGGALNSYATDNDPRAGALGGALFGAAFPAAGAVAKQGAKAVANTLYKEPTKKLAKAAVKSGQTLADEAMDKGAPGMSTEAIYKNASKEMARLEDQLQTTLKGAKTRIPMASVVEKLNSRITELRNAGEDAGANAIVNRLRTFQQIHGDDIAADAANKIKRTLYDKVNNSYGAQAAEGTEDVKAIARAIKEAIEEAAPDVKNVNQQLSYQGRLRDAMLEKLTKSGGNKMVDAASVMAAPFTGGTSLILPVASRVADSTVGKKAAMGTLNAAGDMLQNSAVSQTAAIAGGRAADVGVDSLMSQPEQQAQQTEDNQTTNASQHDQSIAQNDTTSQPDTVQMTPEQIAALPKDQIPQGYRRIRNKQTGEVKLVKDTEASQYGLESRQSAVDAVTPELALELMEQDLQATGGKNIAKIKSMLDVANEARKNAEPNKGKPLSGAQQLVQKKATAGLEAANRIRDDLKKDPQVLAKKLLPFDQSGRQINADMESAIDVLGYFRTGATLTPEQREAYRTMFPSALDDEKTRKRKMDAVIAELESYTKLAPEELSVITQQAVGQ